MSNTATNANAISPAERGRAFQMATRQNYHMMAKQTVFTGATNMRFELPKARFLSKILVKFTAKLKITHASETTVPVDEFTPYKLIRNIQLNLNNGFHPFDVGGKELALLNAIRLQPSIIFPQSSNNEGYCYMPILTASTTGADNEMAFTVEMPVTLNDRDAIGLLLLQATDNLTVLSIDIANGNDVIDNASGYTCEIKEVTAKPMLETFSIPVSPNAYPDLSVLKLVNSRVQQFVGSGQNIVSLPVGTTYRKIAFIVTDENGEPLADSDIEGNIELVFNQADCNYSISADMLRSLNELQLGYPLPKGCYVFDFSNNGIPNYGGTRDFVDSTLLSEMWLRFSTKKGGRINIIYEQIATLKKA